MADVVVRGGQDWGKLAGQGDQRPVEHRLLLGLDLHRLPPELPGPEDGRDAPPEPLSSLPLPRLIFGILHSHMFSWDILFDCGHHGNDL